MFGLADVATSVARATVSIASRLFSFPRESPLIFRGAVYLRYNTRRVFACQTAGLSGFAYRTILRVLAAPNHISPTSPWSWKLSSSCAYTFSQLRQERTSEKRRVMHNGCCAVTVCITYNSRVPSSDDVNSSPVRSVIIPLWFVQVWRLWQCWLNADPIGSAKHERCSNGTKLKTE